MNLPKPHPKRADFDGVPFETLVGRTLVAIVGELGAPIGELDDDTIVIRVDDGAAYTMQHHQDCCEYVRVEDVAGDIGDLLGSPILMAEEVSNSDPVEGVSPSDSFTWTFYKLATAKGYVTLRWLGESNGYYGEEVTFNRAANWRASTQEEIDARHVAADLAESAGRHGDAALLREF